MVNSPASITKAAATYAVTVFAIGFLLGTARVLLLVPRVGPTIAVSFETPIMVVLSWYVSGACMKRFAVATETRTRILVGVLAFSALMGLETALAVGLFHRSITGYLAELRSAAGAIGLAGQVCFASIPLLDAGVRGRARNQPPR